jgi:small ligand-binding sensory domain FIST
VPFAAALSEHPDPAAATGEVAGAVLEQLAPGEIDLVALFVTGRHREHVDDIVETVNQVLRPRHVIGTTAVSVIGGAREVEEAPGIALWAARLAAEPVPVRLEALRTGDGVSILGLDVDDFDGMQALVLLVDPISFPLDDVLASLRRDGVTLPIIGGVASADFAPGANRLVLDGTVYDDGAVGVLLPDDSAELEIIVSQGCRPIDEPRTVTRSERNIVFELAGQPAYTRLVDLLRRLPDHERELAQNGLHVGRVIDEHKLEFGRGDFLIRNLIGADEGEGALAINDIVDVGSVVQFQVRDADAADDDLRALLTGHHDVDAALVFTCNGRGFRLFGRPDHDAELVSEYTGSKATAGMFCAGEIGPIGGRPFLHGFTASVALFRDRRASLDDVSRVGS